jgi:DNA-binding beta-propeller fold protein YncE
VELAAPPGPCRVAHLINHPSALAVSPDGLNLYAADSGLNNGQVDVLARDPTTGALGDTGCVDDLPEPEQHEEGEQEDEGEGEEAEPKGPDACASAPGLESVSAVAVSGDGSAVYALGQGTAVVFSRDAKDGKLTEASCASDEDKRCTSFPQLEVRDAVVSPDGREVYVAGGEDDAVYVLGVGSTIATAKASATKRGLLHLRLECPSRLRRPCAGRLLLTRTTSRRAHGRGHRRVISREALGSSAHFTIAPGRRGAILARLSSAGRRLLERRHRLHLTTIVQADPSGGGSGYGRALTLTLGRR